MLRLVPAKGAVDGPLSTASSCSRSLVAIMGIQLRYFVCIAISLSICGRHANGEEPAKDPIKKLILPGEAFLVQDRPAFVFLPPEKEHKS